MDQPDLSIETQRVAHEAVVTLIGEIDMSTVQHLSKAVEEVLTSDSPPRIVLDLYGVTFCDSQGLGALVVLSRKAASMHRSLILINVGEFLLRVFDITGLRDALTFEG